MKLLKNLGWFLLAVLSFFFGYGLVQSMALSALDLGASIFGVLPLYVVLSGAYVYGVYRWYQTEKVSIQTTVFNRYIWCLLWFASGDYSQFFCQKIRQSINKSYLN